MFASLSLLLFFLLFNLYLCLLLLSHAISMDVDSSVIYFLLLCTFHFFFSSFLHLSFFIFICLFFLLLATGLRIWTYPIAASCVISFNSYEYICHLLPICNTCILLVVLLLLLLLLPIIKIFDAYDWLALVLAWRCWMKWSSSKSICWCRWNSSSKTQSTAVAVKYLMIFSVFCCILTARYIKYLFIFEIIHYYCYPMAFLFIMILNIIVLWCLMWYSMVSMATFGCFRFVHLHTSFTHHIFSICIVSSLILFLCAVCVGVFDVEHRCSCIPNAFIDINLVCFFFLLSCIFHVDFVACFFGKIQI